MNKKGFTLIEILAAMAVLSLITLMIIPNVISSINEAKKSTFVNECRNIYKAANSSYVYDSVKTKESFAYGYGIVSNGSSSIKQLELSGNDKDMCFLVQFDDEGNVSYFYANNGTYQMEKGRINRVTTKVLASDLDDEIVVDAPAVSLCSGKILVDKPAINDVIDDGDTPVIDLSNKLDFDFLRIPLSGCPTQSEGYYVSKMNNTLIIDYFVRSNALGSDYNVIYYRKKNDISINIRSMSNIHGGYSLDVSYCNSLHMEITDVDSDDYTLSVSSNGENVNRLNY